MTSESAAIAPTLPSTDAIIERLPPALRSGGRLRGLRLARERLADGPLVGRLAAGDGGDGRAVEDACLRTGAAAVEAVARALGVGGADRDRERVGGVVGRGHLGQLEDHGEHPA